MVAKQERSAIDIGTAVTGACASASCRPFVLHVSQIHRRLVTSLFPWPSIPSLVASRSPRPHGAFLSSSPPRQPSTLVSSPRLSPLMAPHPPAPVVFCQVLPVTSPGSPPQVLSHLSCPPRMRVKGVGSHKIQSCTRQPLSSLLLPLTHDN